MEVKTTKTEFRELLSVLEKQQLLLMKNPQGPKTLIWLED